MDNLNCIAASVLIPFLYRKNTVEGTPSFSTEKFMQADAIFFHFTREMTLVFIALWMKFTLSLSFYLPYLISFDEGSQLYAILKFVE